MLRPIVYLIAAACFVAAAYLAVSPVAALVLAGVILMFEAKFLADEWSKRKKDAPVAKKPVKKVEAKKPVAKKPAPAKVEKPKE